MAHESRHTNPANVWIEELPKDAIPKHIRHPPAAVEEDGQHAFPELDYTGVLLGLCRLRRVVGHAVLFGDWGDDEGRVEVDEGLAQGRELRVAAPHLQVLGMVSDGRRRSE